MNSPTRHTACKSSTGATHDVTVNLTISTGEFRLRAID